jgi:hypothetical protein
MVDLMREILSKDDYMNLTVQLNHPSDARNLLDFMLDIICDPRVSNQDFATIDVTRRARQLMLEAFSKMHVISPPVIANDLDAYMFPFLLYLLNNGKVRNILSGMCFTQELIA